MLNDVEDVLENLREGVTEYQNLQAAGWIDALVALVKLKVKRPILQVAG